MWWRCVIQNPSTFQLQFHFLSENVCTHSATHPLTSNYFCAKRKVIDKTVPSSLQPCVGKQSLRKWISDKHLFIQRGEDLNTSTWKSNRTWRNWVRVGSVEQHLVKIVRRLLERRSILIHGGWKPLSFKRMEGSRAVLPHELNIPTYPSWPSSSSSLQSSISMQW